MTSKTIMVDESHVRMATLLGTDLGAVKYATIPSKAKPKNNEHPIISYCHAVNQNGPILT